MHPKPLPRSLKAIAAVSLNNAIGNRGQLPWHLPADLAFFKRMTTGNIIVMGRKTFLSIGKPLPNRTTFVFSRTPPPQPPAPNLQYVATVDQLLAATQDDPRDVFICGGAEIYRQLLPLCSDLFLTRVKRTVEGDTFFPEFESLFVPVVTLEETPEFDIIHYTHRDRLLA